MKVTKILLAVALITTTTLFSCKPKDADIQAAIETKLKAKPDMATASVSVTDGVATLSGECKDQTCKADCGKIAEDVKGVKSVINNLSIAAPPPPPVATAPVTVNPDETLKQSVTDATKDYPSVKADVNDGVVTLTGDIKKSDLQKLMMTLNSLKPKKVDTKKLTVK